MDPFRLIHQEHMEEGMSVLNCLYGFGTDAICTFKILRKMLSVLFGSLLFLQLE